MVKNKNKRQYIKHSEGLDPLLTFKEIGDILGISRQAAQQTYMVAITKLQKTKQKKRIREFY